MDINQRAENDMVDNDFVKSILRHHSSSQATIQVLQNQLQKLKTLKGSNRESFQRILEEESLLESSANDLLLSTSHKLNTTDSNNNKSRELKKNWLCSTMIEAKSKTQNDNNHSDIHSFGDAPSPIKFSKSKGKVEFNLKQSSIASDKSDGKSSATVDPIDRKEDCDELSGLFDLIMKTGEKLNQELKESRRRELILARRLSESSKAVSGLSRRRGDDATSAQQQHGEDDEEATRQLKSQCSKLESALLSLQNENIKLNRLVKRGECSEDEESSMKVRVMEKRFRQSETEKVEMQLKIEKLKNIVRVLKTQEKAREKCSCSRLKVEDLKCSLKKSHEMLEDGIEQRKQLHLLLARKESELTDMQVKIDQLELALQTAAREIKIMEEGNVAGVAPMVVKLQQTSSSSSSCGDRRGDVRKNEIEALLDKYEKLKHIHLKTLRDLNAAQREIKKNEEKEKRKTKDSSTGGGSTSKASSSSTARSRDPTFANQPPRNPDDESRLTDYRMHSTPIKRDNEDDDADDFSSLDSEMKIHEISDLHHHGEATAKDSVRKITSSLMSDEDGTSSDLPTETLSVLEKFHDFTDVTLKDELNGVVGSDDRQATYHRQVIKVTATEEKRKNEIGFSDSQQEYIDSLVEKYSRLARDRCY